MYTQTHLLRTTFIDGMNLHDNAKGWRKGWSKLEASHWGLVLTVRLLRQLLLKLSSRIRFEDISIKLHESMFDDQSVIITENNLASRIRLKVFQYGITNSLPLYIICMTYSDIGTITTGCSKILPKLWHQPDNLKIWQNVNFWLIIHPEEMVSLEMLVDLKAPAFNKMNAQRLIESHPKFNLFQNVNS